MTYISPFSSHTLSLFSQNKSGPQMPVESVKVAKPATVELDTLSQRTRSSTEGSSHVEVPDWLLHIGERTARAEAKMEVWHANERKFEEENGFRRRVNSALLGTYASAKSGPIMALGVSTREEAIGELASYMYNFKRDVAHINQNGGGSLEIGAEYTGKMLAWGTEQEQQIHVAKMRDDLDATRMELFAETTVVAKTFGLEGPMYAEVDGKVQFKAQDIFFQGKPLARITEDGSIFFRGENGDPASLDRRV